ncbi:MAG TPA: class I SAM-dependent methyltransferase, partial [Miltoncostaeaceae bacterium]|nr:class I SAM-dependent methyltransferase [Miltoncostaeaceae bacterium]
GAPPMSAAGRPAAPPPPRWRPLVAHSYRLGTAWAARGLRGAGWPAARAGLYRLLVPLEPWRYHELGRVAAEPFAGDCLDVSSPKLLASLLRHEGRGRWTASDLLPDEVARWRVLDPALDLRVEDARALSFAEGSFDAIASVSVIEHVEGDGDRTAMAEMWRVLRPGGVLHLTTNVAARAHDVLTGRPVYGGAVAAGGPHFFERRYSARSLRERLLGLPWEVEAEEYAVERRPVHERFFAARPASFLAGGLLPLVCPGNFAPIAGPGDLPPGRHGVVYLRLRKPG